MANFQINTITGKDSKRGTSFVGVTTVSSTGSMRIPSGPTEQRGGRGRGLFSGGYGNPESDQNIIQMIVIATTGDSTDFGDLTTERRGTGGACASSTRSVMIGGRDSPVNECVIDYVTFSSSGGASTFGELAGGVANSGQCSNATRGICYAGSRSNPSPANSSAISYITLASTGDASDFGAAPSALVTPGGAASPTRGLFAGGYNSVEELKSIDYITIASLGNALDFGELTITVRRTAGSSNSTRAIWAGGNRYPSSPSGTADIDYSTIATLGNAIDFGTLTSSSAGAPAACASSTRSVINRTASSSEVNSLEYVTIMTTGNATDFGDLSGIIMWGRAGSSDVHGGLG